MLWTLFGFLCLAMLAWSAGKAAVYWIKRLITPPYAKVYNEEQAIQDAKAAVEARTYSSDVKKECAMYAALNWAHKSDFPTREEAYASLDAIVNRLADPLP